jgi:serine/threonine-protein kinase
MIQAVAHRSAPAPHPAHPAELTLLDLAHPAPSRPAAAPRTLCLLPGGRLPRRPEPRPDFTGWSRYTGVEPLGEGGMGQVYAAFDPRLERRVALKFLRRGDGGRGGRALHEARLQARAESPHVPQVYEVGQLDGHSYLAMQYLDGPTLKAARRRMSLDERLATAAALCRALDAIHEVGLVHRDVNPRNVLVRPTAAGWWPYVIDFGIAHELPWPSRPVDPRVVGTAPYMAPEQALGRNDRIDRRTDVYSLGATLYELFSGRRPFSAESSEAILTKSLREDPPPLALVAPALPAGVERVVGRCLEKDPDDRYPTARRVAAELEACRDRRLAALC